MGLGLTILMKGMVRSLHWSLGHNILLVILVLRRIKDLMGLSQAALLCFHGATDHRRQSVWYKWMGRK